MSSQHSGASLKKRPSSLSLPLMEDAEPAPSPSLKDLQLEEELAERAEAEEVERKRKAAAQLALQRGLSKDNLAAESVHEVKAEMVEVGSVDEIPEPAVPGQGNV